MSDLTQAVAQALAKVPHDRLCPSAPHTKFGYQCTDTHDCDCWVDREQRLAARVAAAIDAASVAARMGDSLVAVNEAAVRALTSGEAG